MNRPYEMDYHGQLTAWFALMAENMEQAGFVETRFMPALNPEDTAYPNYRWYMTHPVLDVVTRAALVRVFGGDYWVMRLQGLVGCMASALFLLFILRRLGFSPAPAVAGAVAMMATPLFFRLAHLSMQHPMTLACGLGATWCYLRLTDRRRPLTALFFWVLLTAGMQFDWPGYFVPFLLFLVECLGPRRKSFLIGLVLLVAMSLAWVWVHVELIVRPETGLLATLRNASRVTGEALSPSAAWDAVVGHQFSAFGSATLVVFGLALMLSLRSRASLRLQLLPLILAFAYGALHLAAFPGKAPYHDFWGCYWLPAAGLGYAIVLEFLLGLVPVGRQSVASWSLLAASLTMAGLLVSLAPENEFAISAGRRHETWAAQLLEAIPEEDRGVFVSNFDPGSVDPLILGTHLRVNVHAVPALDATTLAALPGEMQVLFRHVRGRPVLFFVAPPVDEHSAEREALKKALAEVGTPYHGSPDIFDITTFVWQ
ncbi:MAG: hypothetical protein KDB53_07450 [Planctomycetes bacterium]|nr:hypothetical protein [Planctomycetota bacterium]